MPQKGELARPARDVEGGRAGIATCLGEREVGGDGGGGEEFDRQIGDVRAVATRADTCCPEVRHVHTVCLLKSKERDPHLRRRSFVARAPRARTKSSARL